MTKGEAGLRSEVIARRKKTLSGGSVAGQVGLYVFLLVCLFIFAFPLVWLFYSSLKPQKEIFESAFALPKQVNISNLVHIWSSSSFPRYYLNSLFVSSVSVMGILAFSTMAGYVFARIRFRGREFLYLALMAGMMIPIQVTLIPNFVFLRNLGLLDTYAAMILPYIAFQIPISIFIMRGFFAELPVEMEDAAVVDGCGRKRIFFSIMLPLSRPAIGTLTIYNFFAVWNELIFALTFTNSQKYRTIPVGLMDFVGQYETDYGYIFAALASASIPLLVVYFFAQKQIIKGLTAGAVKG
jgi:raffinose/stachyose/melibiose transport system permease protein